MIAQAKEALRRLNWTAAFIVLLISAMAVRGQYLLAILSVLGLILIELTVIRQLLDARNPR